jgi:hypothetical protein
MKAYRGVNVSIHVFLASAQVGGEWSASRACRFTPGEKPPISIGYEAGWTPEPGLDDVENRKYLTLPGLELQPL